MNQHTVGNVIKAAAAVIGLADVGMIAEHGGVTSLNPTVQDGRVREERGGRPDRGWCMLATE